METTNENVKEMPVFDALSELKILKKRLDRAMTNAQAVMFSAAIKTKDTDCDGRDKKTMADSAISYWDKIAALNNRINVISGLIYESNVRTPITIGGHTYTSKAAAISRYANIANEYNFYYDLLNDYTKLRTKVKKTNDINLDPEKITLVINPGNAISDPEVLKVLEQNYKDNVELEIFDPCNLMGSDEKLKKILEEIESFRENYNRDMNRSNLITTIQVPNGDMKPEYLK
nr:MAG TPA: septicolysin [Caudoviricetes sp.]